MVRCFGVLIALEVQNVFLAVIRHELIHIAIPIVGSGQIPLHISVRPHIPEVRSHVGVDCEDMIERIPRVYDDGSVRRGAISASIRNGVLG